MECLTSKYAAMKLLSFYTFPESFYSSIVSKIILHLDTHIDIKLRNGQTL